jgi:acetolactate synthase-1/3 small subunit/acetolactate synthase II small subunit
VTDTIRIDFAIAEGAVIRMLGLIERRGFLVRGLGMTEHESGETASMVVELSARDPGRSLDTLDLQLRRLHGITNVSVSSSAMSFAS